ncbi:MAG TPA: HAD family hydrolase [Verrucomicrobiae bacterium]|nr:HAD family hydrolase [Verrucomicrobiae bacterium]
MSTSFNITTSSLVFGQIGNSTIVTTSHNTILDKAYNNNDTSKSYLLTSTTDSILPSWNYGTAKERIINFVNNVTDPESPNYVLPEDRIAVFDNDGTLWSEKPIPFQGFFLIDRLQEISLSNPNIKQNPQIQQLLEKNFTNLKLSEKVVVYLALLTHSNITQPEFNKMVDKWVKTAYHPQTHKRFVEMIYQPMIEIINYLKDNHFKIFIVSGGGVDFMRESLSKVYGIPPDQII